jgi:hypothetical protein
MNPIRVRRWILILLGLVSLVLALGVGLVLSRNQIARLALEKGLQQRTGWKTSVGAVTLGLGDGSLRIQNLRIHNPEPFGGGLFLDLPELYLAYDPVAAATNTLRLREVRLNLSEVQVVVDARGRTNVAELQHSLGTLDSPENTRRAGSVRFAGVDTLVVTVGKVVYRDLRPGGGTRIFSAGLKNETLHQVNGWIDLFPIAMKLFFSAKVTETVEPPVPRPPVNGGTSPTPRR